MKSFITLGLFLMSFSLYAQDFPVIKHYDQQHLYRVALPLGGIGTGTVSISGKGELKDWEIMNRPAKGFSGGQMGNGVPFFSIFIKESNGKTHTKGLMGPLDPVDYQDKEGRPVDNHGIPRFRNVSFDASYPFGRVNLSDPSLPVEVTLTAYNPLIPTDADASGMPLAVLNYAVHNTSNQPITVAVCGLMRNFIGNDGSKTRMDWKGDLIPIGSRYNQNTFRKTGQVQGIFMYSDSVKKTTEQWGTMALVTTAREGVSYRRSSRLNDWENALLDFWDDFSADGELTDKTTLVDNDPQASLAVKIQIPAHQTRVIPFYITWHFPNRFAWSAENVGNYYATQYADAWEVAEKAAMQLPILEQKTLEFVRAFAKSNLPEVVKESALFNLSTLRSQTVFRVKDGTMMGWEGCMDNYGSCQGSCTHVWNYEQATGFLFGKLAQTMRKTEFGLATDETGFMSFRVGLPLATKAQSYKAAAADGQMGTIMRMYRDWQLSGDLQLLKELYPSVKRSLEFAWLKGGWDGDKDGVMEGVQHNTMDVEYYGPNPQMQIWYLGALRAMEEMAKAMGEPIFAAECRRLFEQGRRFADEKLFNGEYYEQIIQTASRKEDILMATVASGRAYTNDPPYQLGKGCLVDQLIGQYMAHVYGLGYLVNPQNVQKTLQSIMKYNYRPTMLNHFNNMRSYALGDEAALLMASYPRGGRPTIPFPYFSEVMTGFEYTAAIGMLYEGQTETGLTCIKNIRDRYDGQKRSPFDEAECGHHYARAMTSWGAVLALTGFQYSGVKKSMAFTPKVGSYFWSNGYAYGEVQFTKAGNGWQTKLTVLNGSLPLENLSLGKNAKNFAAGHTLKEKQSITISLP
ncbi:GH116 family glycosyl-hydrolase [Runella zeae]|uniref:GH116 family glycosyl-hydrolase n=1 Tax=Runella zeae TaxID=94255 RepID=UPI0003FF98C0|nr:GH116 family glycosyl-hydrolase [Runella zeae]